MSALQKVTGITAADLGALLDAGADAVVTLEAGQTRLAAHRAVLAARSPVFAAIFAHDTLEASSGVVSIPDVEGAVLRQLLSYLYTLQAPQLPDMAAQLLAAADKYGLSELKAECERQVARQLTVETAAAAAVLAERHSCGSLRQAALQFVKSNLVNVMATQGWADAMRSQPKDLIEVSRLISAPPEETSAPAPAESGPSPQPDSGQRQTAASADASSHAAPPEDPTVSRLRAPAPAESGPSPQPDSGQRQTAASSHAAPPEDPTVSRLRSLSSEEKGERLIQAARVGAVEELESLLAAGADVGARGCSSLTGLHWAAAQGHVEAARRLLAAGAAVDDRDSIQSTALHCAAWMGHVAVARLLLASGAHHSARNQYGRTPLHLAALCGHREVAVALLQAGADRGARGNIGETPLDLARWNNHQQLVDLLTTTA